MVKRAAGAGGGALTCAERGGASLSAARAPQGGDTPLCMALSEDHSAVAEQLLAAGANKEAQDEVRGDCGVEDGKGSRGNTHFFLLSSLLVLFWFRSRLCGHVRSVCEGRVSRGTHSGSNTDNFS